jgi:hypothetical protein
MGIFGSAVYNLSDEKVIEYNVRQVVPDELGVMLNEDKVLINRAEVGERLGMWAKGTIVNFGKAGRDVGYSGSCTIINYGKTANSMGHAGSGPVINYGETGDYMGNAGSPLHAYGHSGVTDEERWAERLVINLGTVGEAMGSTSMGPIINFGTSEKELGRCSHGITVNAGKAVIGHNFGHVILIKDAEEIWDRKGPKSIFSETDCRQIPELLDYFDDLKVLLDAGRNDYRILKKLPSARKVTEDVEAVLRERGLL